MTKTSFIKYEKIGHIVKITINRPEKRNALNKDMVNELYNSWVKFEQDDQARVAIITGEGQSFSSGMDVSEVISVTPSVPGVEVEVTKPIISAVNGYCVGVGLVIAFMSDIRIASTNAKFMYPEAKLGVTGGMGSMLTKYIPLGIALEMLLVGDSFSAQRAYEVGLANRVVSEAKLMDEAMEVAEKIANNAPMVVKALKTLAYDPDIMKQTTKGVQATSILKSSEDMKEGLQAFKEKRKPNFIGK